MGNLGKPTLADIIKSMFWIGYSKEEAHEVLTGAGYPSSDIWLLIEKIYSDLEEMRIQSKPERFEKILEKSLAKLREDIINRLETAVKSTLRNRKRF